MLPPPTTPLISNPLSLVVAYIYRPVFFQFCLPKSSQNLPIITTVGTRRGNAQHVSNDTAETAVDSNLAVDSSSSDEESDKEPPQKSFKGDSDIQQGVQIKTTITLSNLTSFARFYED
jgi:hypothetical protein